ncbi:polysaccharide pyruvyl transferase family protein [Thiopseudomonas acetoxidans]|uniref:Polysaccharide pyruvyl transferase family protein n=1 Tax=Thiopseudomonas acetoxidans TaxID=3041622 RepID=A0ABT7SRV4_9GAMM|nr:polysaccharide pyruvyl transferase family protein [Thiopseudomonas sp. CY1220]MDM7858926.1 polysaccharide pyruvyl transferase family protein [Thiopseudomonas sp. CY1220]
MKNNSSAFVVGWHAHKNTGDNAMLQVISWLLNKKLNVKNIYLLCTLKTLPISYVNDVELRPVFWLSDKTFFFKKFFFHKAISISDILIFGGGSIFHSENSIHWKLDILKKYKRLYPDNKVIALSVSIGPFPTGTAELLFKEFVSLLDLIVVRDAWSEKFLEEKCAESNFIRSSDFAFFMPHLLNYDKCTDKKKAKKRVGISLKYFDNNILSEKILNAIEGLINNFELEFVFFAFSQEDEKYFKCISRLDTSFKCCFHGYSDSPFRFIELMSDMAAFVGMRLHSQIYATILNIPLIVLDYHYKCTEFSKEVGVPNEYVLNLDSLDASILYDRLDKLLVSRYEFIDVEKKVKKDIDIVNEAIGRLL